MSTLKRIWAKVRSQYARVPNAVRAGWNTAWITFAATFLTISVNLLPALVDAITSKDMTRFTDSLGVAATAATSAITGFLVGVVNGLYRWLRPISASYSLSAETATADALNNNADEFA